MDLGIIVVLMLILYVVPEILRKRRPKKYEYPDIPQPVQIEFPNEQPIAETIVHTVVKPTITLPPEIVIPHVQEHSPWQGKVNNAMIYNGIVFAEILQPPRAMRPVLREMNYKLGRK